MLRVILPTLFTLLSALTHTSAAPNSIFVGCIDGYTPTVYEVVYGISSAEQCATACNANFDTPYTYSGYVPQYNIPDEENEDTGGIPGRKKRAVIPLCACSNEAPSPADYSVASSTDGSAQCDPEDAAVYATDSTYAFGRCVQNGLLWSGSFPDNAIAPGQFASPEACLARCKEYEVGVFQPDELKSAYNCYCGAQSSFNYADTEACQTYSFFPYLHSPNTAVSSQFAKRQLKEKLLRLQGDKQALCPKPLTPCKVGGVSDAFECIDTTSELESCGGCYNGNFNANETSFGVDCTQLVGVAPGAVTCNQGKCQTVKCLPTFTLAANGTCIAI